MINKDTVKLIGKNDQACKTEAKCRAGSDWL